MPSRVFLGLRNARSMMAVVVAGSTVSVASSSPPYRTLSPLMTHLVTGEGALSLSPSISKRASFHTPCNGARSFLGLASSGGKAADDRMGTRSTQAILAAMGSPPTKRLRIRTKAQARLRKLLAHLV